jgi:hypothetical protein
MAVSFNLPDPYEAQKADIARRQKYAQALEQQAFQPVETYSYQGIQAPIPATAALAKVLAGLGAGYFEGQAAREQRELREGDIKKSQEFAAALQGAKTPEEREALTLQALGGGSGQRAQMIAGPMLQMTERRAEAERTRQAKAEEAALNREARADLARSQQENARLIAGMAQGARADIAAGQRAIGEEGLRLRAEDLERRRREDERRAQQLSPAEQRQVFQQQDQIDAGQSTLSLLAQAKDLSGKFRGGAGAGTMAYLGSQARSVVGMAPSEESNALINYDNLVKEQALAQLKTTFGGNPTEGERKVLLELQASSGKTPEQRAAILDRAIVLAQDRVKGAEQRRESLLTRSYRQPAGAQSPAPATPGAPAAPAAPGAPAANIPQAAIDALRAGRGTREQFDAAFGAGAAARVLGR